MSNYITRYYKLHAKIASVSFYVAPFACLAYFSIFFMVQSAYINWLHCDNVFVILILQVNARKISFDLSVPPTEKIPINLSSFMFMHLWFQRRTHMECVTHRQEPNFFILLLGWVHFHFIVRQTHISLSPFNCRFITRTFLAIN